MNAELSSPVFCPRHLYPVIRSLNILFGIFIPGTFVPTRQFVPTAFVLENSSPDNSSPEFSTPTIRCMKFTNDYFISLKFHPRLIPPWNFRPWQFFLNNFVSENSSPEVSRNRNIHPRKFRPCFFDPDFSSLFRRRNVSWQIPWRKNGDFSGYKYSGHEFLGTKYQGRIVGGRKTGTKFPGTKIP